MVIERASGGDVEGLAAVCELGAVLALPSTRTPGGVSAEVARRQRDGTGPWILDRPDVLARSGTGRTTS